VGQKDVFVSLGHGAVRSTHHEDGAINLRGTGDHVLDVVTVSWAVHVRVVPLRRLVLHVRNGNRDPARLLFRRVVNRIKRPKVRPALQRQRLADRRRQCRLAVVNVADCPHIHMGLRPLKLALAHDASYLPCSLALSGQMVPIAWPCQA